MPTITIDLPDSVHIPSDWDASASVLRKIYEEGIIASDRKTLQTVHESNEEDDDSEVLQEFTTRN